MGLVNKVKKALRIEPPPEVTSESSTDSQVPISGEPIKIETGAIKPTGVKREAKGAGECKTDQAGHKHFCPPPPDPNRTTGRTGRSTR